MTESWRQQAAELRRLGPAHILFLCVQNSARSQLAEALARHLAPEGLTISSAGSRPAQVRPEVFQVLEELGVDSAGLRSKGLDELELSTVDAVITLCAEEVCPVLPGPAMHVHWALPDPAAVTGPGRLQAFRQVRNELLGRFRSMFSATPAPVSVKVLGTGCAKCNKLYAEVEEAVAGAGVEAQVEKVEGIEDMMAYGVMMTPALVVDGQVKSSGKIPKREQIMSWLTAAAMAREG